MLVPFVSLNSPHCVFICLLAFLFGSVWLVLFYPILRERVNYCDPSVSGCLYISICVYVSARYLKKHVPTPLNILYMLPVVVAQSSHITFSVFWMTLFLNNGPYTHEVINLVVNFHFIRQGAPRCLTLPSYPVATDSTLG